MGIDENTKTSELLKLLSPDEKLMLDFIKRCLEVDPKVRMTCE